jgi:hypothetical protein
MEDDTRRRDVESLKVACAISAGQEGYARGNWSRGLVMSSAVEGSVQADDEIALLCAVEKGGHDLWLRTESLPCASGPSQSLGRCVEGRARPVASEIGAGQRSQLLPSWW